MTSAVTMVARLDRRSGQYPDPALMQRTNASVSPSEPQEKANGASFEACQATTSLPPSVMRRPQWPLSIRME